MSTIKHRKAHGENQAPQELDQEASLSRPLEARKNDQLDVVQPPVQSDSKNSDPNPVGDDDQVENPEKEDLSTKLLSKHLEELGRSGISQNQVETSGLYSCSDDAEIRRLLNWKVPRGKETKLGHALVFPFFNVNGEQLKYARLKLDHPRKGRDGKAVKYEAPKGERNFAYFPPGNAKNLSDSKLPLLITEGEKKAIKAVQEGFSCIGLTGIWGWQKKRNKDKNGKATGERKLIPELEAITWKDRDVFITFDSDRTENFMIVKAEWALAEVLASKGANVRIVELPSDGDEKVGLDDFLLKHSAADLQSLIDAAVEPMNPNRKQFEDKKLKTATDFVKKNGAAAAFEMSVLEPFARACIYDKAAYGKARTVLKACKVGLRDFDRALQPIMKKKLSERPAKLARNDKGNYFVEAGCICRRKSTPDGPVTVQTNNFTAEIVTDVMRDDGAEVFREYEIKGELHTGQPLSTLRVSAIKFAKLEWIPEHWGAKPIVWAGEHNHIPAAIQGLSKKTTLRAIFAYTGWRKIRGHWVYLHGDGAIGNSTVTKKIEVELPDALKRFCLPTPPTGNNLKDAIRASLALLEIGEAAVTYPIVASVFRSVLGPVDFSMGLFGASGVFKTQMAALAQQFFGPELDAAHLPASWTSTVNSNEGLAFANKDAVLVIDDFAPGGSANDVQRLHRDADRLLRGAANGTGRGRMRSDGSLRPSKYSRGLIISTGEDTPYGQSLRARIFSVEVSAGNIDAAKLTTAQHNATSGLYASAMAGFLQWLSPRLEKIQQERPRSIAKIRSELKLAGHARTSGIVGDLLFGFKYFMKFAEDRKVISPTERKEYINRAKEVFITVAGRQRDDQQTADPANHFLSLITAVLASHAGHLTAMDGSQPENANAWGWTEREVERGFSTTSIFEARSPRIGWIDESKTIFLEPQAAFSAAQRIANAGNSSLAIQISTLWKRLYEGGYLARIEESGGKKRYKVRVNVSGRRRSLIALRPNALDPDDEGGDKNNSHDDSSELDCASSSSCNPATYTSRSNGKDDLIFGDFVA